MFLYYIIKSTFQHSPPLACVQIYSEQVSGTFTDVWQAAASTLYMCTGRRPNRHLYLEAEPRNGTLPRVRGEWRREGEIVKVVRRGDVGKSGERQFCAHKRGKMERRRGREGNGGKGEDGRGMEGKKERKGGRWRERRRGREGDGGKEEEEGREMKGKKERKGGGWRERRRGRKGDGCVGVSQGGERTGMDEGNEGGGWGDERGRLGWNGCVTKIFAHG